MKQVRRIINATEAIKNEFTTERKIDSKLSFRLSRFEDKASGIINSFKKTQNKLIIEKYGEKLEDDKGYQVPSDKMEEYLKEVNILLEQEEDFDYTISISLFEGEKISKEFFNAMGDFITE
jgi:hypothetical protein